MKILFPDKQVLVRRGVIVQVASDTQHSQEASIRMIDADFLRVPHIERRRQVRWLCSDDFHPTGVAANPAKSNDFILFRVFDVSRSGMRLLTSLRNNFITRGMRLDVIVSFPMVSQITLRLTVQNVAFVSLDEKEYLSIGAEIIGLTPRQSSVVAQYMAQFGDVESLREFRESGFDQSDVVGTIEYSVVRTEEDYREVLNLRHLAYLADNKIASSASVHDVSDIHDSHARILICKFRGKTIATARLTFHEVGDITEHEEFVAWGSNFPRRDESVEVTRACTHPDFRRTGLFFALLRYVAITATQAGRIWVVTSSTEDLVPMYQYVGLRDMGLRYNHPDLNHLKHAILIGSMLDGLSGRSVGPIAWNQIWRYALPYMSSPNSIAQDTLSGMRIALYRSLGPLLAPFSSIVSKLKRSPHA
jgi:predicted GNAT family N-acyltransferase